MQESKLFTTTTDLPISSIFELANTTLTYEPIDRIWSPYQESYLVESILAGLPMMPIYMLEECSTPTPLVKKSITRYIALNGRETIDILCRLVEDKIVLQNHFDLKPSVKGKKFHQLSTEQQHTLWDKPCIRVVLILHSSDEKLKRQAVRLLFKQGHNLDSL